MKRTLGNYRIDLEKFARLGTHIKRLKGLKGSTDWEKSEEVNRALLSLVQKAKEPCFLLPAVLEFIERIESEKVLEHYTFNHFESWLNQFSGLSFEENYRVRAKIAGKYVERGDYQSLFPIGMGKVWAGTHFVTAHKSPDLDTTIASFWGWLDAFAARVGEGTHVWNLPDGPPPSQIEIDWIFRDLFGPAVFTHLPKTRSALNLTGHDLVTQKGVRRRTYTESIAQVEHDPEQNAVILVDEKGHYLGDWRATDVEGVRQVIILLSSCLRWFENHLHLSWIHFFTKDQLHLDDITPILQSLLHLSLRVCEPAQEFTPKQSGQVDDFLRLVLKLEKGLDTSFEELALELCQLGQVYYGGANGLIERMKKAKLFDAKGYLIEDRKAIFAFLEKAIEALHLAILQIRTRLEKLDIALKTKYEVFAHHPTTVTLRADLEEIRNKMGHYSYLTVVSPDQGKLYPIGVVQAADVRKERLGTVSLRDFCNREEMGIPPYLEVISVIDHHKSALQTYTPPMAILSDAQSSNTLVAQKAFEINDSCPRRPYFIHPARAFVEYLHFLYGIIDDTDLLSKVSALDVQCVASLLNRLKSLMLGKTVKIIKLDDLPRDKSFAKKAAERILQNEDMYSLYRKVYEYREKEVEKNLSLCARGEASNLFADTKEQNGCCRVGQTKLFAPNIGHFAKQAREIRSIWLQKAIKVHKEKPEVDLHIHMMSTIVNAEEVYRGTGGKYTHRDELWIWIPEKEIAVEHLKKFLNSFQASPGLKDNPLQVEFLGDNAEELAAIFKESFLDIPQKKGKGDLPMAVLQYKAASLNSRKAMISPFLPTL